MRLALLALAALPIIAQHLPGSGKPPSLFITAKVVTIAPHEIEFETGRGTMSLQTDWKTEIYRTGVQGDLLSLKLGDLATVRYHEEPTGGLLAEMIWAVAPPVRNRTPTVSAGIPNAQLKIEAECAAKFDMAKSQLLADPRKAIALLDQAADFAAQHGYLEREQGDVLRLLASAYAAQGRPVEAANTYKRLFRLYGECDDRNPATCAEVEVGSGFGELVDKRFASALVLARMARVDYVRQQQLDTSEVDKNAHKIKEAEVLFLETVTFASTGDWSAARATANETVALLRRVLAGNLPDELRDKAEHHLRSAEEALEKSQGR